MNQYSCVWYDYADHNYEYTNECPSWYSCRQIYFKGWISPAKTGCTSTILWWLKELGIAIGFSVIIGCCVVFCCVRGRGED